VFSLECEAEMRLKYVAVAEM